MARGRDCNDCAYLDAYWTLRGRLAAFYDAAFLLLIVRNVLLDIIVYQRNTPFYM